MLHANTVPALDSRVYYLRTTSSFVSSGPLPLLPPTPLRTGSMHAGRL